MQPAGGGAIEAENYLFSAGFSAAFAGSGLLFASPVYFLLLLSKNTPVANSENSYCKPSLVTVPSM
jgi:hypothetical protein